MTEPRDPFLEDLRDDIVDRVTADSTSASGLTDLRDRVVIMLLFNQRVQAAHVERAMQRREELAESSESVALWRLLADDPELDRDAIFREAAQLYSFEPTGDIARMAAISVIGRVAGKATEEQVQQMAELGVVPVALEDEDDRRRLVFASHDPIRPEVVRLVEEVAERAGWPFIVRYAPEGVVRDLVDRALAGNVRKRRSPISFDMSSAQERVEADEERADTESRSDGDATSDGDIQREGATRSELIELFEEALVAAVRHRAQHLLIHTSAARTIEILFRVKEHLVRWHVEKRVAPEVFLTVVTERTRTNAAFGEDGAERETISRWIGDARVQFHVQSQPIATADGDRVGQHIRIGVLDDRRL